MCKHIINTRKTNPESAVCLTSWMINILRACFLMWNSESTLQKTLIFIYDLLISILYSLNNYENQTPYSL